jgi:hypothetical protein
MMYQVEQCVRIQIKQIFNHNLQQVVSTIIFKYHISSYLKMIILFTSNLHIEQIIKALLLNRLDTK